MRSESDLIPYHASDLTGRRALVFAPHPDDETIGCGGALALHRQAGDPVRVVVLTNGARGDTTGRWERDAYIALRKAETLEACAVLGVDDIVFLGYEDRELGASHGAGETALAVMEAFRPGIVYCPSPLEFHPDHRAACYLVCDALRGRRFDFDLAFYEINQPVMVNTLVDITPVIQLKRNAIAAYRSQLSELPYDDICISLSRFRSTTLPGGATHAEGFLISSADIVGEKGPFQQLFEHIGKLILESENPSALGSSLIRMLERDMSEGYPNGERLPYPEKGRTECCSMSNILKCICSKALQRVKRLMMAS